jgi:glucokinase
MEKINSNPIVMTLDAGGTNFVFSGIQDNIEIIESVHHPSNAHDLDKCLETIIAGFEEVNKKLPIKASAISFAFPGPADYSKGIIGNLPNFKAFTDGVALGPMLEEKFNLPVFINNDGNLFAYGEALCGFLPELNRKIKQEGGIKQFNNLIGLTLGTGFGCGVVLNNIMLVGDNSNDTGIHLTLNKFNTEWDAEESVSTRAIQRIYCKNAGIKLSNGVMPKDIFEIAQKQQEGNQQAAIEAYQIFGEGLGSSIANILTIIDGIVVIGGGITSAWNLFAPSMFKEINRKYQDIESNPFPRLPGKVYNLENKSVFTEFARGHIKELIIPDSTKTVNYDELQRNGIGKSKLGASKAIALGAYAFALQQLGK